MFQASFPLAIIAISIRPCVSAEPFSPILAPIPNIQIIQGCTFPYTFTLAYSTLPLAVILLTIGPLIDAVAVCFTLAEISNIVVAVWMLLITSTVPQILLPRAFVSAPIHV